MKKICFALATLVAISVCCAAGFSDTPESSIPTPAENGAVNRGVPEIGVKENADWQRLREERREAREQILSRLKNSTEEKEAMRKNANAPMNPKSAVSNGNPVVPPHERNILNPMVNPMMNPFVDKKTNRPMVVPPGHMKDNLDWNPGHMPQKPEKSNPMFPVHP